jgi:transcription elongation GreA/GreB family factor
MVKDWRDRIGALLEKEKDLLMRSLVKAKFARDNAPSAMESHSDTTRSEQEKLVTALEMEIDKLDQDLNKLVDVNNTDNKVGLWSYVEIRSGERMLKFVLVPRGMGGKKIEDTQLVSIDSPVGNRLIGKTKGEEMEFNGKVMLILETCN